MHPKITTLLHAMRAHDVPPATRGLWRVAREPQPPLLTWGWGWATTLRCVTAATMHLDGDLVMIDHQIELQKHLDFVLQAQGRVLVTGLGLGCVIRGLLAHGRCDQITVLEKDPHVIALVWPSLSHEPSLRLIEADALEWATHNTERFDCAWHDLWCNTDTDEGTLHVLHAELFTALRNHIPRQGAWAFPRMFKRRFSQLQWIG